MPRPTVIVALGGGAGHLGRALVFASRFAAGAAVTILHTAGAPVVAAVPAHVALVPIAPAATRLEVRARLRALLAERPSALVADTFPAGLAGEIDGATLRLAAHTTLIRRYVKPLTYPGYDRLAARFDEHVLPYAPGQSEWLDDDTVMLALRARAVGPMVRRLRVARTPVAPLVVIGPPTRVGATMQRRLPRGTQFCAGRLHTLPAARAYLATAAGYNLSYELLSLGVPFGLMPVERRYDDQFRRADLLGRTVVGVDGLERLLAEAA